MTYSIVARDAATGAFGACSVTAVPCVGALAIQASLNAAVCTQAYVNTDLALQLLERVEAGESVDAAGHAVIANDSKAHLRQLAAIGSANDRFAHTGNATLEWTGHLIGEDHIVAGNRIVGEAVLRAVSETFSSLYAEPFAERLVRAMAAGLAAGGEQPRTDGLRLEDTQGSAALLIAARESSMTHNVRVDAHPKPLQELTRILEVIARGEKALTDFYRELGVTITPFFWRRPR